MIASKTLTRLCLGVAIVGLCASPVLAQETPADAPAAAATDPASPVAPATATSGTSSGVEDQVKDEDVFGFDISMGSAQLTDEQRIAARNTCNEKVMTNAVNYSGAVRTFCQQIQ